MSTNNVPINDSNDELSKLGELILQERQQQHESQQKVVPDEKLKKIKDKLIGSMVNQWTGHTRMTFSLLSLSPHPPPTTLKYENGKLVETLAVSTADTTTTTGIRGERSSSTTTAGMTSKLLEYTTRVNKSSSSSSHPNQDGSSNEDNVEKQQEGDELEFCSQLERRKAKEVIFSQNMSRDDRLNQMIKNAPGMTTNGLLDIIPKDDTNVATDDSAEDEAGDNDDDAMDAESPFSNTDDLDNATSTNTWWDERLLDDDSLFGDSSSEEESTDDDSDDESNESDDDNENESNDDEKNSKDTKKLTMNSIQTPSHDNEKQDSAVVKEDEQVDELLHQITVTVDPLLNLKKLKPTNKNASNNTSWASTTSIANLATRFPILVPNPAISYPFELDDFQKNAVVRLEQKEHVFVAAHTSAGKTVVAEYAIALAKGHCTRAVYTSPIKALSNQKYRDFCLKFGKDHVGLITGDLQLNPDAPCLIVTTEILRSMLYRGADLIRDVEYVIFDEVHYINDMERGVVWEEVIIMLPDSVNLIFLSATTPNTIEFSDWIGRTKNRIVHVITTSYRPVPLSHYLYTGPNSTLGTKKLPIHKIMEGKSGFLEFGWKDAKKALLKPSQQETGKGSKNNSAKTKNTGARRSGSKQSSWLQSGSKQDWTSLVKFLQRQGYIPTVVFSFSKKKCEEIANMLRTLDLNTAAERNAAHSFTLQTIARLSPKDQILPQVIQTCEMVKRGIGVHHGGLLPILKEMVEILFSRNLIKVLFATETFAMGVNMPARAVVFNSIRKHDGTQFRELLPGEYTQMAGRAGRRGLDKVGTVIMCCFGEEPPPIGILRNVLTGSSTKLVSRFRLTYNMILNLLRVEDMSVEGMIKRSFSEFATQRALSTKEYPKLLAKGRKTLKKLEEEFEQNDDVRHTNCVIDILDYYHSSSHLLLLNQILLENILKNAGGTGGGALATGRILLITSARKRGFVRTPAIVIKAPTFWSSNSTTSLGSKPITGMGRSTNTDNKNIICLVLLPESYIPSNENSSTSISSTSQVKPGQLNYIGSSKNRFFMIQEVALNEVLLVSQCKHRIDANEFYSETKLNGSRDSTTSNNPFAKMKPMGGGKKQDHFDSFAGMVPRSKKGGGGGKGLNNTNSIKNSQDSIDQAVSFLLDAESVESNAGLSAMDLRECLKGTSHQGTDDSLNFRSDCDRMEGIICTVRQFQSHRHPNLEKHYTVVERMETLRSTVNALQHMMSNESLHLFPDFLQRKSVLCTLGYVDKHDTVCVKGRVACEVNTCEELIATEMVFEGILDDLDPPEIVAVLSALIFQEKSNDDDPLSSAELPDRLKETCEKMKLIAIHLGELQKEHGLDVDPQDYCDTCLKFGLVHVVYEWSLGVPFSDICSLTMVQEGSIVRCITRLDELCREIRNCTRVVGNPTLYRKMEAASVAIKRDIVFASSLYVS